MHHKNHLLRALAFILLLFSGKAALSGELQVDLNGFRLEQYVAAAEATFGAPFKEIDTGESVLRGYRIDDDAYMVIGHSKLRPHNISSLQLTGKTKNALPFRTLNLGDDRQAVLRVLGVPTKETAIAEPKLTKLSYEGANFSVELDSDGRLYSILIFSTAGLFEPKFGDQDLIANLQELLSAQNVGALVEVLRPDVEIYRAGKTLAIGRRLGDFLVNPDPEFASAFFDQGTGVAAALKAHAPEGAIRMTEKSGVGFVYKFPPESVLQEIAFFPFNGTYRIYEVSFRDRQ